jgi:hypothetical protein
MTQQIQSIPLGKLVEHPDNPNRMSEGTFKKLVRNIELTGRYEPIIVRLKKSKSTDSERSNSSIVHHQSSIAPRGRKDEARETKQNSKNINQYEIINGHHRVEALKQLGYETADCLIWDVDDHEAGILLATLNRLGGTDALEKKLALLKKLNQRMHSRQLAKLLPQTSKQIERLTSLKLPSVPAKMIQDALLKPVTFFVNSDQHKTIRRGLSLAEQGINIQSKAKRNAAALTRIAESLLNMMDERR